MARMNKTAECLTSNVPKCLVPQDVVAKAVPSRPAGGPVHDFSPNKTNNSDAGRRTPTLFSEVRWELWKLRAEKHTIPRKRLLSVLANHNILWSAAPKIFTAAPCEALLYSTKFALD